MHLPGPTLAALRRGMETMWDDFGDQMEALGANVPWMLANGNHERCASPAPPGVFRDCLRQTGPGLQEWSHGAALRGCRGSISARMLCLSRVLSC